MVWPDGRKYEGLWSEGLQDGIGIYTNRKGISFKGVWSKGKKVKNTIKE
jgi:hypothetical protein